MTRLQCRSTSSSLNTQELFTISFLPYNKRPYIKKSNYLRRQPGTWATDADVHLKFGQNSIFTNSSPLRAETWGKEYLERASAAEFRCRKTARDLRQQGLPHALKSQALLNILFSNFLFSSLSLDNQSWRNGYSKRRQALCFPSHSDCVADYEKGPKSLATCCPRWLWISLGFILFGLFKWSLRSSFLVWPHTVSHLLIADMASWKDADSQEKLSVCTIMTPSISCFSIASGPLSSQLRTSPLRLCTSPKSHIASLYQP